ncbi:MAG TPA: FixH family protein [Polyangiaceae bacterium]|nr:FixH family protein [Polyangiaceae bacterium]
MLATFRSRLWAAAAPVVVVTAGPVGCSGARGSSDPITVTSASGALSVEVVTTPEPPSRGTVTVEMTVKNTSDGAPRDGLTLDMVPWMPAHDHGTSLLPVVMPEGGGKYLFTQVGLYMPGHWELQTTISGPVQDYVAPAFDIP